MNKHTSVVADLDHEVKNLYASVIDLDLMVKDLDLMVKNLYPSVVTDLYTTSDIKQVREQLIKEQQGLCAMTGCKSSPKDFHLDHRHDQQQYVRAALYKQANMALGKVENLWTRNLSYWYEGNLQQFLRQTADYLDKTEQQQPRWRHTGWMQKARTAYNALKEQDKEKVLAKLCERSKTLYEPSTNGKERKQKFDRLLLDRSLGFSVILGAINGNG